jgi:hypothetical protein
LKIVASHRCHPHFKHWVEHLTIHKEGMLFTSISFKSITHFMWMYGVMVVIKQNFHYAKTWFSWLWQLVIIVKLQSCNHIWTSSAFFFILQPLLGLYDYNCNYIISSRVEHSCHRLTNYNKLNKCEHVVRFNLGLVLV